MRQHFQRAAGSLRPGPILGSRDSARVTAKITPPIQNKELPVRSPLITTWSRFGHYTQNPRPNSVPGALIGPAAPTTSAHGKSTTNTDFWLVTSSSSCSSHPRSAIVAMHSLLAHPTIKQAVMSPETYGNRHRHHLASAKEGIELPIGSSPTSLTEALESASI